MNDLAKPPSREELERMIVELSHGKTDAELQIVARHISPEDNIRGKVLYDHLLYYRTHYIKVVRSAAD